METGFFEPAVDTIWPHSRSLRIVIVILAAALSISVFFRAQILNGFTLLFADRYDGVIEISILEHWYNVFRGLSYWNVTGYFFPHKDTLGYNDGYLLYGVIYSLLRRIGADPFLGSELTNVVVKSTGFLSFFLTSRRVVRLGFWFSVAGSILFTLANNSFVQAVHVQLFSVSFSPLMVLLVYQTLVAFAEGARARAVLWGLAAGAFYSAWLLTCFYMAWFFGLFAISLTFVGGVFVGRGGCTAAIRTIRQEKLAIGVIVAGFVIEVLPFLYVYLPIAARTGLYSFRDAMYYSPSLLDVLNLGADNLMYGSLDRIFNHWLRPGFPLYSERTTGFPPLFLLLFIVGMVAAWRNRRHAWDALIFCISGSTLVLWFFVLHVRGVTAWHLIFDVIPGARAVRVIARLQIFLAFPASIVVARGLKTAARSLPAILIPGVCFVLVLEQINTGGYAALNRPAEMSFLRSLANPPSQCQAFYAATEQPHPIGGPVLAGLYSGNVAAMLVANYDNLPTINGYSTFNPPDWNFGYPERTDYLSRVRTYAIRHHISGLCGVNFRSRVWLPPLSIGR
jgi:hypothetical protein